MCEDIMAEQILSDAARSCLFWPSLPLPPLHETPLEASDDAEALMLLMDEASSRRRRSRQRCRWSNRRSR